MRGQRLGERLPLVEEPRDLLLGLLALEGNRAGPLAVGGRPRDRVMRIAATTALIATLVMIGGSLVVWGGLGFPRSPMSFVRGPLGVLEISAIGLVYAAVGAFLIGRVPGYIVGWSLIAIGVGVGLHLPVNLMVGQATRVFHPIPVPLLVFAWGRKSP